MYEQNTLTTKSADYRNTTYFNPVTQVYIIVINLLYVVIQKLPETLKSFCFKTSIFLIVVITVWRWTNKYIYGLIEWDHMIVLYIFLFLVLLLTSIDRRILAHDVRWKGFFWIGWYLCFELILLSAFLFEVNKDYYIWSILSLFYYPALFIVWQVRDDFDTLFHTIAWSTVVCSFIFFVASILGNILFDVGLFPDSFIGIVGNPNANGMVATGFFAAGFYLAFADKKINVLALISMAISISLSIESICRTAELAIIMMAFMGWLFYVKTNRQEIASVIKKTLISMALLLLLTFSFCTLLKAVMNMDIYAYAATANMMISPESYTELNTLSSGRLVIWQYYTQDINLFGHGLMDTTNLPDYYRWAHNNLIDILYISGALAALGYLIWLLHSLLFVVRCTFGKTLCRPEYLFVIVSVIGYFVEAMLEVTIFPMTAGIVFMAFMGLALVSGEKNS